MESKIAELLRQGKLDLSKVSLKALKSDYQKFADPFIKEKIKEEIERRTNDNYS